MIKMMNNFYHVLSILFTTNNIENLIPNYSLGKHYKTITFHVD
jgi:hypothetical protein